MLYNKDKQDLANKILNPQKPLTRKDLRRTDGNQRAVGEARTEKHAGS